jgi:hypothetical protein
MARMAMPTDGGSQSHGGQEARATDRHRLSSIHQIHNRIVEPVLGAGQVPKIG